MDEMQPALIFYYASPRIYIYNIQDQRTVNGKQLLHSMLFHTLMDTNTCPIVMKLTSVVRDLTNTSVSVAIPLTAT